MSWKWICSSFLVEVTLANLVKRFDWKVDVGAMGDDKPDVAEAIGIDVCRKDPLIVCPSSADFILKCPSTLLKNSSMPQF